MNIQGAMAPPTPAADAHEDNPKKPYKYRKIFEKYQKLKFLTTFL